MDSLSSVAAGKKAQASSPFESAPREILDKVCGYFMSPPTGLQDREHSSLYTQFPPSIGPGPGPLHSLCLTCQRLEASARPAMYRHIHLLSPRQVLGLLKVLHKKPWMGLSVRFLSFDMGTDYRELLLQGNPIYPAHLFHIKDGCVHSRERSYTDMDIGELLSRRSMASKLGHLVLEILALTHNLETFHMGVPQFHAPFPFLEPSMELQAEGQVELKRRCGVAEFLPALVHLELTPRAMAPFSWVSVGALAPLVLLPGIKKLDICRDDGRWAWLFHEGHEAARDLGGFFPFERLDMRNSKCIPEDLARLCGRTPHLRALFIISAPSSGPKTNAVSEAERFPPAGFLDTVLSRLDRLEELHLRMHYNHCFAAQVGEAQALRCLPRLDHLRSLTVGMHYLFKDRNLKERPSPAHLFPSSLSELNMFDCDTCFLLWLDPAEVDPAPPQEGTVPRRFEAAIHLFLDMATESRSRFPRLKVVEYHSTSSWWVAGELTVEGKGWSVTTFGPSYDPFQSAKKAFHEQGVDFKLETGKTSVHSWKRERLPTQ